MSTERGVSTAPGWDALVSASGTQLLARIDELLAITPAGPSSKKPAETLTVASVGLQLRSEVQDRDLLAAALTQTELRAKAPIKFGALSPSLLFTQAGLEQASRLPVSELHAARFTHAGCDSVADLGCGLGAESLAFQRSGLRVRAVEIDPLTAKFARHNLAAQSASLREFLGQEAPAYEVLEGDATGRFDGEPAAGGSDGVFLDPARRTAGHRNTKRVISSDDYSPSLDFAFEAARAAKAGGVKLGPGFDREHIPADAEAQWVSVDGALVEMGLWFGAAAREDVRRSALILRGRTTLRSGTPVAAPTVASARGAERTSSFESYELTALTDSPDAEARPLGEYLVEPDGAVIRARLIGKLAEQLDAGMIHDGIAYLTTDRLPVTPFGQTFRIVEELPSREKALKKELTKRGIGKLEIKKRGVDVDPAALRVRLRLKGERQATLILTRSASGHVALLAERC